MEIWIFPSKPHEETYDWIFLTTCEQLNEIAWQKRYGVSIYFVRLITNSGEGSQRGAARCWLLWPGADLAAALLAAPSAMLFGKLNIIYIFNDITSPAPPLTRPALLGWPISESCKNELRCGPSWNEICRKYLWVALCWKINDGDLCVFRRVLSGGRGWHQQNRYKLWLGPAAAAGLRCHRALFCCKLSSSWWRWRAGAGGWCCVGSVGWTNISQSALTLKLFLLCGQINTIWADDEAASFKYFHILYTRRGNADDSCPALSTHN